MSEIKPDDLLINYYLTKDQRGHLSQPPRGCRVLHKPTGIVIVSETGRSSYKNLSNCLTLLEIAMENIDE